MFLITFGRWAFFVGWCLFLSFKQGTIFDLLLLLTGTHGLVKYVRNWISIFCQHGNSALTEDLSEIRTHDFRIVSTTALPTELSRPCLKLIQEQRPVLDSITPETTCSVRCNFCTIEYYYWIRITTSWDEILMILDWPCVKWPNQRIRFKGFKHSWFKQICTSL